MDPDFEKCCFRNCPAHSRSLNLVGQELNELEGFPCLAAKLYVEERVFTPGQHSHTVNLTLCHSCLAWQSRWYGRHPENPNTWIWRRRFIIGHYRAVLLISTFHSSHLRIGVESRGSRFDLFLFEMLASGCCPHEMHPDVPGLCVTRSFPVCIDMYTFGVIHCMAEPISFPGTCRPIWKITTTSHMPYRTSRVWPVQISRAQR